MKWNVGRASVAMSRRPVNMGYEPICVHSAMLSIVSHACILVFDSTQTSDCAFVDAYDAGTGVRWSGSMVTVLIRVCEGVACIPNACAFQVVSVEFAV